MTRNDDLNLEQREQIIINHKQKTLNSYKLFLHQKLEPALRLAVLKKKQIEDKLEDYRALLTRVEELIALNDNNNNDNNDTNNTNNKMIRFDIGSEILCDAEIINSDEIFIDIGLQFFCAYTLTEAQGVTKKYIKLFEMKVEEAAEKTTSILEHCEIVYDAIKSLTQ
jgi:pantothenate kinase-related protein Tda10